MLNAEEFDLVSVIKISKKMAGPCRKMGYAVRVGAQNERFLKPEKSMPHSIERKVYLE